MHKDYSEQELEALLKRLPKVKDNRSADEVFDSILENISLETEVEQKEKEIKPIKHRKKIYVPLIASAAAALIIAVLSPSLFENDIAHDNSMSMESTGQDVARKEESNSIAGLEQPNDTNSNASFMAQGIPSHVIQEVPEGMQLLSVPIPDETAQYLVPISFVVPEDEKLTSYLNKLDTSLMEEQWGLSPYLLSNVTFNESDKDTSINIDLAAGTQIQGSLEETLFVDSIKQLLDTLGFKQAILTTNGNPGIELSNYGVLTSITASEQKANYYVYHKGEGYPFFLLPIPTDAETVGEAILEMSQSIGDPIKSAIVNSIKVEQVDPNDADGKLTITFSKDTTLIENEDTLLMLEAMLMTAKEFGYGKIQFVSTGILQIGPYDLSQPIKVPSSVNEMMFVPEG